MQATKLDAIIATINGTGCTFEDVTNTHQRALELNKEEKVYRIYHADKPVMKVIIKPLHGRFTVLVHHANPKRYKVGDTFRFEDFQQQLRPYRNKRK